MSPRAPDAEFLPGALGALAGKPAGNIPLQINQKAAIIFPIKMVLPEGGFLSNLKLAFANFVR